MNKKKSTFIGICLTLSFSISCKSRSFQNDSEPQEMQKIGLKNALLMPTFKLKMAEPIPHSAYLMGENMPKNLEASDAVHVDVRFGKITESQFKALQKAYSGEKSIKYIATRDYNLVDFLPRIMQATLGHRFAGHFFNRQGKMFVPMANPNTSSGGNSGTMGLTQESRAEIISNCWGTTYEYVRNNPAGFSVFYAEQETMQKTLWDDKYSEILPPEKVKFGDVLLVSRNSVAGPQLAHTAIYVDDGLFFEKTGTGDEYLYRLARQADLLAHYGESYNKWTYRRYNKQSLPDTENLLKTLDPGLPAGISVQTEAGYSLLEGSVFISYVIGKDGTYALAPQAYEKKTFEKLFTVNGATVDPNFYDRSHKAYCISPKDNSSCMQYRLMNVGQLVDLKRHSGACQPVVEEKECPLENSLGSCVYPDPMPDGYAGRTFYVDPKSAESVREQLQQVRTKCSSSAKWIDGKSVPPSS